MIPGFPAGTANGQLKRTLLARMHERGRLTFAEFTRLALYEPGLGYYARAESPIGTDKDFFTSVSASPVFGKILAELLRDLRRQLGETSPFCVYEFGSHRGQLRADITRDAPELDYQTFEHGDALPEAMTGCVLSNELMDAMPFHRLKVVSGRWQEMYVEATPGSDGLGWSLGEPSDPRLTARIDSLPLEWMEGYETEVCLAAEEWLHDVAARLEAGFVVTFDYGFEDREYFGPHRVNGGLRCFHRHQVDRDPFVLLGEKDITADVNFSALIDAGERAGLETVSMSEQSRFLVRVGADVIREISDRTAGQPSPERNALHLLTNPSMLGPRFKVLIQRKR